MSPSNDDTHDENAKSSTPGSEYSKTEMYLSDEKTHNESAKSSTPESEDLKTEGSFDSEDLLGSLEGTPFADEGLAKLYAPPDTYESKHRFAPGMRWSREEEKKLLRKIDIKVLFMICILFSALNIDRYNLQNATTGSILGDLGMNTNDYNNGNTIFNLCFLAAELPSQLVSKKLGVDIWVPTQMVLWSIITMAEAAMTKKSHFYAFRAILAISEGGFIPDIILYMSYYYKGKELLFRLTFFWVSLTLAQIVSSFLTIGLLSIHTTSVPHGWQWLFIVEGAITLVIGIFAFFWLPPSPTQTKGKIRGKGWFTEREEYIIVTRVLLDDPTKSDMHNRQAVSCKSLLVCLRDYRLYPMYLNALTQYVGSGVMTKYASIVQKDMGFSVAINNTLNVPPAILMIVLSIALTYGVVRVNERTFMTLIPTIWQLPLFIALATIPQSTNKWARWVLILLVKGNPYPHGVNVGWVSENAGSVAQRSVASSLYNMFTQIDDIIASQTYRENDRPMYHKGSWAIVGILAFNFGLHLFIKWYYKRINRTRERRWNAASSEEKAKYLSETKDAGNKRLDYRFRH